MIAFVFHFPCTSSSANQSSNSGWLGKSPWLPNSSLVETIPMPNSRSQILFTTTREVSGLRESTSHLANAMRSSRAPSATAGWGNTAGTPAVTSGPRSCQLPRCWSFVTRCLSAASSSMTGTVARFSSASFFRRSATIVRAGRNSGGSVESFCGGGIRASISSTSFSSVARRLSIGPQGIVTTGSSPALSASAVLLRMA